METTTHAFNKSYATSFLGMKKIIWRECQQSYLKHRVVQKRNLEGVTHFMCQGSDLLKPNFMPHQAKDPQDGGTAKKVSKKGSFSRRGHWTSTLTKCLPGQYSYIDDWLLMDLETSLVTCTKRQDLVGGQNSISHKKRLFEKPVPCWGKVMTLIMYMHPFVSQAQ